MADLKLTIKPGCPSGKVSHAARADAERHSRRVGGGNLAYPCDLCGQWHVGRKRQDLRDERARRGFR